MPLQNHAQWQYNEWLADTAGPGVQRLPPWRAEMYTATGALKRARPADYRDAWECNAADAAAEQEFSALLSSLTPAGAGGGEGLGESEVSSQRQAVFAAAVCGTSHIV